MTRKRQKISFFHQEVDVLVRTAVYTCMHNLMAGIEVIAASHMALLPETRTSNPVSKLLRPLMEHKRIRAVFGANLAGALILVGAVSTPGSLDAAAPVEVDVLPASEVVVTTEQRFQLPLEQLTGISQGFSVFHRGIDLRAPLGTAVKPMTGGRVAEVELGRFGYGYYVVVEHEGNLSSLYAHLGNVAVKVNDEVTQETTLGTVGMTGWTTGPHLHLEVYEQGKALNPASVVPLLD